MNRLTKTDSRRGRGVPGTQPPSVRAAGTCAPVVRAAATRAQARAIGVPQDAGVPQTGASPVGGGGQCHLLVKGKSSVKDSWTGLDVH